LRVGPNASPDTLQEISMSKPVALVIGVGAERGLGAAVARRFAAGGHRVLAAGRTAARIEAVAQAIVRAGGVAEGHAADATREDDVHRLFDRAFGAADTASPRAAGGDGATAAAGAAGADADVVVFNAGNFHRGGLRDVGVAQFEDVWRTCCLGGFLVAREAARRLAPRGRGTLILTGASASLRGKEGFAAFAAAKAGLRMIAQSAAREFGPQGLHVAHVVIDGVIDGERLRAARPQGAAGGPDDGLLDIEAIAESYWQLHRQHRSAWTQELDLRPWKEGF
jgi:NAD(P)-dependent dehydrogenase (short-subunit alcohol dehydrogenase family)